MLMQLLAFLLEKYILGYVSQKRLGIEKSETSQCFFKPTKTTVPPPIFCLI